VAADTAWDLLKESVDTARGNANLRREWTFSGMSDKDLEEA